MLAECRKFFGDERAATAIEYGLIAAFLAVALIVAISNVGGQVSTVMSEVSSAAK